MLQTKRAADDDLTESSKKNGRVYTGGGETLDVLISGDLHPDVNSEEPIDSFSDSGQSVWSELSKEATSKISRNVVSLALSDGHTVLFACSGIALRSGRYVTSFLTSASLVRAFNDNNREGHDTLNIEVRRNGEVAKGILKSYDSDQGIVVVQVLFVTLGVHPVDLSPQVEFLPCRKVVAVTRADSGTLMVASGILAVESSGSEDGKQLMFSTCKISEAWEGGSLFDYDGNFVGLNLSLVGERIYFMPRSIIIERLEELLPKKEAKTFRNVEIQREVQPWPYCTYPSDRSGDLDSLGYPKPSSTVVSEGLVLVNTFEETFGEVYDSGKGVMGSHSLPRRVVSLASFSGERRFFVCTGLFIDWNGCTPILTSASLVRDPKDENKIAEKLKIEVLLPNKERKEGKLQHYNLYYNVALIVVEDYRCLRPARIHEDWWNPFTLEDPNVVAVGRCFKSGRLMATHGRRTGWSGMLDYRDLRYSSCKITKAGIGGPLLDFNGRFIGMNFYDKKIGTPFIFRDCIIRVLANFVEKCTLDFLSGILKCLSCFRSMQDVTFCVLSKKEKLPIESCLLCLTQDF
ncbi:unnamed protein product [Triticum turgidum subsp. durum]|uniref:Uncharacterized protein n=1 Tax=Triticum turgidum subsp. durum TaxID=4567 RepID=A0A9R0XCT9_TRITD|nr:unnamed protein product [Triticum turgidum subsp. durum]